MSYEHARGDKMSLSGKLILQLWIITNIRCFADPKSITASNSVDEGCAQDVDDGKHIFDG